MFRSRFTIARGCLLQSFCCRTISYGVRSVHGQRAICLAFVLGRPVDDAGHGSGPAAPLWLRVFVCFASGVLFAIVSILAFIAFLAWLGVRADIAVYWRGQRIQILIAAPSEQQISIPNNEAEVQDTASDIGSGAGGSSDTALRRRAGLLNATMPAVPESDTPNPVSVAPAAAQAPSISSVGSLACPRCGRSPMVPRRSQIGDNFYGCASFPDCRGTRPSAGSL